MSKPFFVELAGLPGAGKTTTASMLIKELSRYDLRCALMPEAATRSPLYDLKGKLPFNIWSLTYDMTRIIEYHASNEYDVVVIDRGLFDGLCWFTWLRNAGEMSNERLEIIKSFVEGASTKIMTEPYLVLVLRAKFKTALLRRKGEMGRIVNPSTYMEVEEAYEYMLHQPSSHWLSKGVHTLDTDALSPKQVCDWTIARINDAWPFLLTEKPTLNR